MRRLPLLSLVFVTLLSACGMKPQEKEAIGTSAEDPRVGQMAPPVDLVDLNGKRFSLAESKGRVVFLDFWATWCPPCQRSTPEVIQLESDYAGKGVEIVSISLDENKDAVTQFVSAKGMKNRVIYAGDSDVSAVYGVRGIPMFVLIDKEGRIAQIWTGFHPTMVPAWRSGIDRLLGK